MDKLFNKSDNKSIEIQADVLSRLPLKKLLVFKAVCKSRSDLNGKLYYVDLNYNNGVVWPRPSTKVKGLFVGTLTLGKPVVM